MSNSVKVLPHHEECLLRHLTWHNMPAKLCLHPPSSPVQGTGKVNKNLKSTTLTTGNDQAATEAKIEKLPSISDLDSIFGPVLSPKSVAVNTEEKWVHFSDASPEHVTPELTPKEKVVTPPAGSDIPADSPAPGPPGPPGSAGPPGPPGPRNVPSPLNLEEVQKKVAEQTFIKDDYLETLSSPKECGLGQRATPPPPPPPTYRTVVSSPGPGSGSGTGTTSGMSHCSSVLGVLGNGHVCCAVSNTLLLPGNWL